MLNCLVNGLHMASMLAMSCTANKSAVEGPVYSYDAVQKKCVDKFNNPGLNPLDPGRVFAGLTLQSRNLVVKDRNAQCINFAGVKLHSYIGVGYNVLENWDFRGSDLSNAQIHFNFILDGRFEGSTLNDLVVGYGRVKAQDIDFNTGDMAFPARD